MSKRSDEKLIDILEVSECPAACQTELRALVREGASLKGMLARFEELKKRIAQIVIEEQGLINSRGIYGVRDGPHCVIVREQAGRKTLDRELLIENGVQPWQIEASFKTGKPFTVAEFEEITGD